MTGILEYLVIEEENWQRISQQTACFLPLWFGRLINFFRQQQEQPVSFHCSAREECLVNNQISSFTRALVGQMHIKRPYPLDLTPLFKI